MCIRDSHKLGKGTLMERKERVVCLIKRYPYHHVMKWMFENNPVAARAVNLSAAKELIFSQLKSDVARVNDTIYLLKLSLLS